MKNKTILLSIIMLTAIVLSACGAGEETKTSVPATRMPPTKETLSTTETPLGTSTKTTGNTTTTPGIPVTGAENPSRISNELDFHVWNQDGEEIGEVKDMVIDVDNAKITYVIVGTGGFMNIGEKDIVVPWNSLTLQTAGGAATGGQQNAFILQTNPDTFKNFPDMDWKSTFPKLGQPAGNWDTDIRNYWENGTIPGGTGTGTQVPSGTKPANGTSTPMAPNATSTSLPKSTATPTTNQGLGQGLGLGNRLQGVMLATDVLGSTIKLTGLNGTGNPSNTPVVPKATATSSTGGTGNATATPGGSTLPKATATLSIGTGNGTGNTDNMTFEVKDMIVDTNNGKIMYVVVTSNFSDGERWIPIPLALLQWDSTNQTFGLDTNGDMLNNAPFFTEDQFPDTMTSNWDSKFSTYWKSNGNGTGTGTGTTGQATATSTGGTGVGVTATPTK